MKSKTIIIIVSIAVSYDGNKYYTYKEVASPEDFDDIIWLFLCFGLISA